MPDLTVVVPIYNVENYLNKCVMSILGQTYVPKKIILVDDGSTDESGKIADELASKSDRITVIHKENGGLSSARNCGIDIAQTEYITFVDSDDYIDKNMYQQLMFMMHKENADIAIGGVWYEQENGEKHSPYPIGINKTWAKDEALKELNSYRYFNMSFCNKIFKTELFFKKSYGEEGLRFPVGKTSEDYYLMHKIIARADKIVYTSQPFYHYIQRGGSISRGKSINLEQLNASLAQVDFYQKWFPHLAYIAESACAFTYMAVQAAYLERKIDCPLELRKKSKNICRKYLKSILKNDSISNFKKIQALIFRYSLPLYKVLIKNIIVYKKV